MIRSHFQEKISWIRSKISWRRICGAEHTPVRCCFPRHFGIGQPTAEAPAGSGGAWRWRRWWSEAMSGGPQEGGGGGRSEAKTVGPWQRWGARPLDPEPAIKTSPRSPWKKRILDILLLHYKGWKVPINCYLVFWNLDIYFFLFAW